MKKEIYLPYFENKKVTVMGLGLLGRGIGDTAFLASCHTDLTVTDKKTKEELSSSLEALNEYKNINYKLGSHELSDFENRDFILKAAGVPLNSDFIKHAQDKNIPVYMSAALVCDIVMKNLPNVVIIGITGTRGKSTTTQMIAHILRENGCKVHIGGNVRGIANLPLLEVIEDDEYLVLELDSWQLQGFGDMKNSPHIAVFTSFMDDHMNYYNCDRELYFNDKAKIYRNQKEGDVLIASQQAQREIIVRDVNAEVIVPEVCDFEMKLIGSHNKIAAGLAYEVALQCGLDDESVRNSIKTFSAVEGRLEDLGLFKNNVRVFNDNNATTGDATVAAIKAINEKYNIKPIIILGGSDKGLDLLPLEKEINENTKAFILLAGTGTDKLNLPKDSMFERLNDCVDEAFKLATDGDIILFAPSFASFSKYFNNEYERNDAFVSAVQKYKNN
ncbi:MAG: UDP-N-acetylmuramoyl-L-alanine--D-glutamate ligase [Candidatus Paceibacterota bacterium]|jgi:UDP-N-acetylmuramoylalanine--D-glutamate ligase